MSIIPAMRAMGKSVIIAAISVMFIFPLLPTAQAGSTTCDLANPIIDTTIDGNVIVPEGEFCLIRNSTINGNITAKEDSRVSVGGNSVINGNFSAKDASGITIGRPSVVNGNVDIKGTDVVNLRGGTYNGFVKVKDTEDQGDSHRTRIAIQIATVEKNIEVKNNSADAIIINGNDVGNDILVIGNTAEFIVLSRNDISNALQVLNNVETDPFFDSIIIRTNTINGNAHCNNNLDATDEGSPNTYNGKNNGCP